MSRHEELMTTIAKSNRYGGTTHEGWVRLSLTDIAVSLAVIADALVEMAKHDDRLTDDGK